LAGHAEQLAQLVKAQPDASLEELRKQLPVAVGSTTVWRVLRVLEFTFKKVLPAAEQDRPDAADRLVAWQFWCASLDH
jgi:transposase